MMVKVWYCRSRFEGYQGNVGIITLALLRCYRPHSLVTGSVRERRLATCVMASWQEPRSDRGCRSLAIRHLIQIFGDLPRLFYQSGWPMWAFIRIVVIWGRQLLPIRV